MKAVFACSLFASLAFGGAVSPVSRVVELLKDLSKTVEKEGKAEEDLFETFVCWGNSVIKQKTASNAEASSEVDSLETYVADLAAGRIELTTERDDLEKDIAELSADIEQAEALRKKETADYDDAKAEMEAAIAALKSATDVLGEATKAHKTGVLMAVRSRLNGGMEAFAQQQTNLKHAVTLGQKFLDKADATFLRRLLTGDVPKADWKKLNRKATFKMAYKARSFKIQEVLKKMLATFKANLADAEDKETAAKADFAKLSKAKGDQLAAAQAALTKGEAENGARGQSKDSSEAEIKELKAQIAADEKFIAQTKKDLVDKKAEFKTRTKLRAGELQAISKAIYILHSDDARDNFKKSFASQEGFFFLQEEQQSAKVVASSAGNALNALARKSGDTRLLALADMIADPSAKTKFAPIIGAMDKMIAMLKSEEADDLKIKEECEKGRMEDTRKAVLASREIDDMTDTMSKIEEDIEELAKIIASLGKQMEQTKEELAEATKIRQDENKEWQTSNAEDKEAAETVANAQQVLEKFYADNKLMLVQRASAPDVEAGEAPPPPPATWDGAYGGKTKESTGIIAMLTMVHEDILKDMAKAKAEEDEAQGKFDAFKKESEAEIKDLGKRIAEEKGEKGKKETAHGDTKDQRRTKKGELDAVMKKMKDVNPNCEYYSVNYKLRVKNRQIEIDGIVKAKAMLQGAKFPKAPDPSREIKPGDAFLQRRASA